MKIDLPDDLHAWAAEQAQRFDHKSADAFVAMVLTQEMGRQTMKKLPASVREQINQKLREALASGPSVPLTPEFWQEQDRLLEEYIKSQEKAAG